MLVQTTANPEFPDRRISDDFSRMRDAYRQVVSEGGNPNPETYIGEVSGPERQWRLRQLFLAECELHVSDNTIDTSKWLSRYPELKEFIDSYTKTGKPSTFVLGDYELIEPLGAGGMGCVWRARNVHSGQIRAVKRVRTGESGDEQLNQRILREVQILSMLNHRNIVDVIEPRKIGDDYWLVMEHIEGASLQKIIDFHAIEGKQLSIADACELAMQVAQGLQHLHQQNIVHRDIKPSNLMLDRTGMVKIVDFGLARRVDGLGGPREPKDLTGSHGCLGTADYIAPEQVKNSSGVDPQADIYSLGCTLYCLLSGSPPFAEEKSTYDKMKAHCGEKGKRVPALSKRRPDVAARLAEIVGDMMARDAELRYDAAGTVDALAPWCDGSDLSLLISTVTPRSDDAQGAGSVSTRSPTKTTQRASRYKFQRRQLGRFILGGSVAALGLAGGGYLIWPKMQRPRPELADLATTLATLPGLNGKWWFHEIPEFAPPMRQLLVEQLLAEAEGVATGRHADAAKRCIELFDLIPSVRTKEFDDLLTGELARDATIRGVDMAVLRGALKWTNCDPRTSVEALKRALAELNRLPEVDRSTSLIHLMAAVEHTLALNSEYGASSAAADEKSRKDYWEDCIRHYQQARDGYEDAVRTNPSSVSGKAAALLLQLCDADRAVMRAHRAEWESAAETLSIVKVDESAAQRTSIFPPFFSFYCLCQLAQAHSQNQSRDEAEKCFNLIETSLTLLPAGHPLQAHYWELRGLHCLDWGAEKLVVSIDCFQQANAIRRETAKLDKRQKYDEFANRHRIALGLHWNKKFVEAKKRFKPLLDELLREIEVVEDDVSTRKDSKLQQYHWNLVSLYINARERYADCFLFGEQSEYLDAAKEYDAAINFAVERRLDTNVQKISVCKYQFRRTIALRLHEGLEKSMSERVAQSAAEARNNLRTIEQAGEDTTRFKLLSQCCELLVAGSNEIVARRKDLHDFLRAEHENYQIGLPSAKTDLAYLKRDDRQLVTLILAQPSLEDLLE